MKVHDWLTRHVHGARPRSAIGKAIQYTLNQWAALTVCADHPEIPHNNTSELRLSSPPAAPTPSIETGGGLVELPTGCADAVDRNGRRPG